MYLATYLNYLPTYLVYLPTYTTSLPTYTNYLHTYLGYILTHLLKLPNIHLSIEISQLITHSFKIPPNLKVWNKPSYTF